MSLFQLLADPRNDVIFLATLTLIIAVHEAGHYITARLLGMKVLEFAFGFPPRAFVVKHAGIEYSVNYLPFGGFVRILGQDDFAVRQEGEGQPGSFTSKPWWSQAIVLAAGVVMNFVLAIALLTVAFMTGTTAPTKDIQIFEVVPGSPAQAAGVKSGDIIRAVDGRELTTVQDLVDYIGGHAGSEITLSLERAGQPVAIRAVPRVDPPRGEGPLGIRLGAAQVPVAVPLPEAIGNAFRLSGEVIGQIAQLPSQLLSRRTPGGTGPQVGGPIAIFQVTSQVAQYGLPTYLNLVGVLSLNLGVLNIVPFPGLDGGRLFFVVIGGVLRRRLSPRVEAAIHMVGIALLFALLIVVSVADIQRAIGG